MIRESIMTAQSSADGLMPFIDPGLDDLTREFCHAARYWFDQSGHLVAVWGVGTNGHFGVSWDRWLKRQDIAPLRAARSCERLAGQLLERVRQRWPLGMAPHSIGLITDGSGVAVAPEDPWPLAPGWLDRRIARPGSLVALRRFDPAGNWALISQPSRSVAARRAS